MTLRRRSAPRPTGFTLIELVITLALLGLLALLAAPVAETAVQRSREQELRRALREIRTAIDQYHLAAEQGRIVRAAGAPGYPPDLETLVTGVPDAHNPQGGQIYFLRRIPRDPFVPDTQRSAAATWGLRSYASPPDDPREGEDVFDVFSTAAGLGLDGTPYRDW